MNGHTEVKITKDGDDFKIIKKIKDNLLELATSTLERNSDKPLRFFLKHLANTNSILTMRYILKKQLML